MTNAASTVWLNGVFADQSMQIAINDRGFLLGDGAFETLLIKDGVPVFLEAHLSRLTVGLAVLRIPMPDMDEIGSVFEELAQLNGVDRGKAVGRLTVTRGTGARGLAPASDAALTPTILATVDIAPAIDKRCLKLHLTERIRDAHTVISSFKSLSGYAENQAARFEAADTDCDEALMINASGRIACAATANIFTVDEDGVVRTPPVSEGAMPGVVRNLLLEISKSHGISIKQAPVEVDSLAAADSLFLTNSLIGVAQAHVDGGSAAPNGTVAELANLYQIEIDNYLATRRRQR